MEQIEEKEDSQKSSNQPKEEKRTTRKERITYSLFFLGQNFFYMLVYLYLSFYFTDVALISPSAVATIFLGARIWDAVNDPMMGIIVDRVKWKNGRFKPWMKLSTFLLPVICISMFIINKDMSMALKITLAAITYVSFGMAYTLNDAPAFSLSTVMSDNVNERASLLSSGRVTAAIATLIVAVGTVPLSNLIGWTWTAVAIAVIGFATMLPASFICKERYVNVNEKALTFKEIWNNIKKNKFLFIFLISFLIGSSLNFVETIGTYVAKYSFNDLEMVTIISAISLIPMLLVPMLLPILMKKFDKKTILIACCVINIIFSIANYFGGTNIYVFATLMFFRCVGLGGFTTLSYMFVADCIEYGAFKTGKKAEGVSFSLQTFCTKMAGALSGALPLYIFGLCGLDANKEVALQSTGALNSVWICFTLIPAIGMAIIIPIMLFGYKLNDNDIQLMAKVNQHEVVEEELVTKMKEKYKISNIEPEQGEKTNE